MFFFFYNVSNECHSFEMKPEDTQLTRNSHSCFFLLTPPPPPPSLPQTISRRKLANYLQGQIIIIIIINNNNNRKKDAYFRIIFVISLLLQARYILIIQEIPTFSICLIVELIFENSQFGFKVLRFSTH